MLWHFLCDIGELAGLNLKRLQMCLAETLSQSVDFQPPPPFATVGDVYLSLHHNTDYWNASTAFDSVKVFIVQLMLPFLRGLTLPALVRRFSVAAPANHLLGPNAASGGEPIMTQPPSITN